MSVNKNGQRSPDIKDSGSPQYNTPPNMKQQSQQKNKKVQKVQSPGQSTISPLKQYDFFEKLFNQFSQRFKKELDDEKKLHNAEQQNVEKQEIEQQNEWEALCGLFKKLNYLSYQQYMNKQQTRIVFTIVVPYQQEIGDFLQNKNCEEFQSVKSIINNIPQYWDRVKAFIFQATDFSIQIIFTKQEIELYQFKLNEKQQDQFIQFLKIQCKYKGQLKFNDSKVNPFSYYFQDRKDIVDNEFHCYQDRIVYPIQGQPFDISYMVSKDFWTYFGQVKNKKRHGFGYTFSRNFDAFGNNHNSIQSSIYENDEIVVNRPNIETKYWGYSFIKREARHYQIKDNSNYTQLFDGAGKHIQEKKSKIIIKSVETQPAPIDQPNTQNEQQQQQQQPESWGVYDSLIYSKDLKVLRSTQWLNSSIIDGYVHYLNKTSYSDQFKNQDFSKRVYILDSTFYSNAEHNTKTQLDQFLTFNLIDLPTDIISLFDIFETILLVINVSNSHWHSVQIKKVEQMNYEYIIYDSMFGNVNNYKKKCQIIDDAIQRSVKTKFKWNNKIIDGKSPQQQDGFSCGDHTCLNLKYLIQGKQPNYTNELKQIREELYDLLKYKQ